MTDHSDDQTRPADTELVDTALIQQAPQIMTETPRPEPWLANYAAMARAVAADYITVPKALQGKPASVLSVALRGKELGLGFMESLSLIDIINGTPAIRAELKNRWIHAAGHRVEIVHRDHNRLRLRGVRGDTGAVHEVEWAISRRDETSEVSLDATVGEEVMFETWEGERGARQRVTRPLTSKDNWANYPMQQLWARAIGQLHKEHFPDTRGASMYAVEEMEDVSAA